MAYWPFAAGQKKDPPVHEKQYLTNQTGRKFDYL